MDPNNLASTTNPWDWPPRQSQQQTPVHTGLQATPQSTPYPPTPGQPQTQTHTPPPSPPLPSQQQPYRSSTSFFAQPPPSPPLPPSPQPQYQPSPFFVQQPLPTQPEPQLQQTPSTDPVLIPSHFDAVTEHTSPGLLHSQLQAQYQPHPQYHYQQPVPGTVALLPRPQLWDTAIRRFSAASTNPVGQQKLVQHIDTARTAYARAFVAIQRSITDVDAAAILTKSSETDVARTAMEMFKEGGGNSGGKSGNGNGEDRGRVGKFLDILHHYHVVFDVLSQAGDFGYLAVIWGGMRLMLMMAKNKRELLGRITDMLVEIGLTLSRIEVYAKLFPTARMIELISMLYAAVADFLEDIILHFQQRSALRKLFSSLIRPFDEKFGRAMDRIHRLETCIEKDASLLHALQAPAAAHHQLETHLHRTHFVNTLNTTFTQPHPLQHDGLPHPPLPDVFNQIKSTLFRNFRDQASYHESLAATYSVTARAWEEWFAVEQRHLPSSAVIPTVSRLSQGLCDAPDYQHALQWVAQQRRLTPDIPSAYLIWARGMTVHTAIASLVFQVLQQRPGAVAEFGLDLSVFDRAVASVTSLWGVFTYLMRRCGGCLIYISIGSAGDDEFVIVEKFVEAVKTWDGPPIWVTIIHPYHEGFVGIEEATDLDGLYDVHPSLTTTDALHHVLMLELDIHQVSETIQTVLWEAVWRETRYAAVGISYTRVVAVIQDLAAELAESGVVVTTDDEDDGGNSAGKTPSPLVLTTTTKDLWIGAVQRWLDHPVASNTTRELVQRHLDVVPLAQPEDVRADISRHLKCLVLRIDERKAGTFAERSMTQTQRYRVWDTMKQAIVPGSEAMFCASIRSLLADAMLDFAEIPCRNMRQANSAVMRLLNDRFGMDGAWKGTMSRDDLLMVGGIKQAIMTGFKGTIEALSEPDVEVEVDVHE
ncbi:uncharacterized protein C8A04DRAFT_37002 [Dichotomopilus funicola]|uniref:DUF7708 domain-containing protein n=1 Tax=Dichotomopilus funicola TaxID=1934379 RepID=A0AAN6ZNA5_9PEZI|nr:hypothetical protein C8A04DRAFT_37002 [Dichotomopilus funicola]